jgi:hypothetical protein
VTTVDNDQPFQGRPSALSVAADSCVRTFGPEPIRHRNPAAIPSTPGGRRFAAGDVTVAARNAVRFLADTRLAGEGISVPTAPPGSVGSVQKSQIKQINVMTAYRWNGVGGAPPRGRPN